MLIGVSNVKISLKERHVHFFYIQSQEYDDFFNK